MGLVLPPLSSRLLGLILNLGFPTTVRDFCACSPCVCVGNLQFRKWKNLEEPVLILRLIISHKNCFIVYVFLDQWFLLQHFINFFASVLSSQYLRSEPFITFWGWCSTFEMSHEEVKIRAEFKTTALQDHFKLWAMEPHTLAHLLKIQIKEEPWGTCADLQIPLFHRQEMGLRFGSRTKF